MVRDWFSENHKGWNEELIKELVADDGVDQILSIRICSAASEDLLGWHYNKDGIYSFKSGYWLARHLPSTQTSQPLEDNIVLKHSIWKLKTTPKIKHFLWRMVYGALATGEILRRRHISTFTDCRRCYQGLESTKHLFFSCEYAKETWRGSGISKAEMFDPLVY